MSFHRLSAGLSCNVASRIAKRQFITLCVLCLWPTYARPVQAQSSDALAAKTPSGMVYVAGGPFIMGTNDQDRTGPNTSREFADANPQRTVNLPPFYIDKTEVTNAQYKQFCDATHYPMPPHWKNGTYPDGEASLPVYNVNWWEAGAYAAWAGKRLPTEAEWEKTARGTDGRRFPWGNDWEASRAVWGEKKPLVVGSKLGGASPYGALDMAGNVMEWTTDWYQAYPGAQQSFPQYGTTYKVVRGGGFMGFEFIAMTFYRCVARPQSRSEWVGFRCVQSAR